MNYLPSTATFAQADSALLSESRTLMEMFGAPYGLIFDGRAGIGTGYDAAVRSNVIRIGAELGGGGRVSRANRSLCEEGIMRVLAHFGAVERGETVPADAVQFLGVASDAFVYASADGVFEPAVSLGDSVRTGDLAGLIIFQMP
ncbi:hypothetical protein AWV80_31290 [Cupriavidus sp. UYMU48A]|nr:hypothetical protein AWV80_31290 [Cupriavidus sp. UYMU48A]